MIFNNVGIIDDSLGGVFIINSIENCCSENFIMISDNKNFPYSLRRSQIKNLSINLQEAIEKKFIKLLIVTNPAIALNLNYNVDYEIINGLEKSFNIIKENKDITVLSNKYVKEYLEEKGYKNIIDGQILINSLNMGDSNDYIVSKLMEEYLGDSKSLFILDSNLSILKGKFLELYPEIKFYFLSDIILEELQGKLKSGEGGKSSYYVTDYRIAFYTACEDLFKRSYIRTRKIKI
ncbi:hypothetical protein [Anaerosphaera multitolerans]|uniref:Glutamate racemase n=1 Tax=Anaerosphaera multitolerans TaxID=2487351 RepID=A0A437S7Q3_9FIRM|nr:hypothetical protein [Anaerosphaera multitolerans]RVU55120.1 hypothetical protein EF514_04315 [Anaerosphaera multitolerans]